MISIIMLVLCIIALFYALKTPKNTKQRFTIGMFQALGALAVFIWAKRYSNGNAYIFIIVATVIFALLGIGNIVIGVLNSASEDN